MYFQRFDSLGARQGATVTVVPVNNFVSHFGVAAAMDPAGRFAVAWYTGGNARVQLYDADGSSRGAEFEVDPGTPQEFGGAGAVVSMAMGADGDFAVAWDRGQTQNGYESILARRISANGTPLAAPFRVNEDTGDQYLYSNVDMNARGDFVIGFNRNIPTGPAEEDPAVVRAFDAAGNPLGPQLILDRQMAQTQPPRVAIDGDGDFTAIWIQDRDGSGYGAYARRYLPSARVVARHAFYNNSALDGSNPFPNESDDAAIDAGRHVRRAGEPSGPGQVTGYAKGINGIMVDITGLPAVGLTAADIATRSGPGSNPSTFTAGPAPASVTVRRGAGVGGSDRVTLIWLDYSLNGPKPAGTAVADSWLEVTLRANDATGLATADVFYLGNLIGDDTGDGVSGPGDFNLLASHFGLTGQSLAGGDFNGDGTVGPGDFSLLAANFGRTLTPIQLPSAAVAAKAERAPVRAERPSRRARSTSPTSHPARCHLPIGVRSGHIIERRKMRRQSLERFIRLYETHLAVTDNPPFRGRKKPNLRGSAGCCRRPRTTRTSSRAIDCFRP